MNIRIPRCMATILVRTHNISYLITIYIALKVLVCCKECNEWNFSFEKSHSLPASIHSSSPKDFENLPRKKQLLQVHTRIRHGFSKVARDHDRCSGVECQLCHYFYVFSWIVSEELGEATSFHNILHPNQHHVHHCSVPPSSLPILQPTHCSCGHRGAQQAAFGRDLIHFDPRVNQGWYFPTELGLISNGEIVSKMVSSCKFWHFANPCSAHKDWCKTRKHFR